MTAPTCVPGPGSKVLEQPKLYSVAAIDLASGLFSVFAGFVLLSRNFSRLGNSDAARNSLLVGLFATFIWFLTIGILMVPCDLNRLAALLSQGVQVLIIHILMSRFQKTAIQEHEAAGGKFYSRWRAVGAGVMTLPVSIGILTELHLQLAFAITR